MEFKFKIQDYQTEAVNAVIKVFEGQPFHKGLEYARDLGKDNDELFYQLGYGNSKIELSEEELFHNITQIQQSSNIPVSESLSKEVGACSLDIEMETGTGKTFVYIKTMFELNKKYGWSKFIVVVPSIAIREGVNKSFEMTANHFLEQYKKKARFFVYDSDKLEKIEDFSSSSDLYAMIINMQAFNTSLKEGAANKYARKIYSERDNFGSRRPIDVIKANRPILILDEPQKMEGTKTQDALKNFNPLFSINYSATHRKKHNAVYVLDALDAYNKRLVKKIEVKGFEIKNIPGTDGYLFLHEIILSTDKPPLAKIEFEKIQKNGIKRILHNFQEGESIYSESGEMTQYAKNYFISSIDPRLNTVTLGNGITLTAGEATGDVSEDDIRRIQIRETIISHFEKEEELFNKGIKTLSLFFIDEVAKYRQYDDNGNILLGEYGNVFEEEYEAELENRLTLFQDTPYQRYLRNMCSDVHNVHNGYFSIDKKTGHYIDSKESEKGTKQSDDISAYDLILKNKERLLSFDEPTRFIFSHSALREGWDNPNIFQICTLKHSNNDVAQRQEVGRGLRICVDKDGNRMDKEVLGSLVFDINKLTVIASDSYASFVSSLQNEMIKDLAERPRKADMNFFLGKTIIVDGKQKAIDKALAKRIYSYLNNNNYVDYEDDTITPLFKEADKNDTLAPFPADLQPMKDEVLKLVRSVFDPSALNDIFKDARATKVKDNPLTPNFYKKEFQELWKAICPKYTYKVEFDSEELIKNSITHINQKLDIKKFMYVVRKGEQKDDLTFEGVKGKDDFHETYSVREVLPYRATSTRYDLVGRIAKDTSLTRKTIVAILKGIQRDVFDMFKVNPELFMLDVARLINEQKATMVVQHISYNEAKNVPPYDSSIFTAEKTERDFIKAHISNKCVQQFIFPDGSSDESIERKFAKDLDTAGEVVVYAKLPRGFQIPTPMGGYSPDWAIVFNKDKVKHVFFVAETKGSMSSLQLRDIEKSKIACAKKLFEGIKTEDIQYNSVTTYDDLYNKVMA